MNNTEELKNEICRRKTSVGTAEFQLVYDLATEGDSKLNGEALIRAIEKELESWRSQFMAHGIFSPASTMLPAAEWDRIYKESEKKVREHLLESSSELTTLDKLERDAAEAQRRAKQQADKLERLYNEWAAIPGQGAALGAKLNLVGVERERLTEERLTAEFRGYYRRFVEGDQKLSMDVDILAARIATRDLRLGVLAEIENAVNGELNKLEKRNAELAKILGRPRHQVWTDKSELQNMEKTNFNALNAALRAYGRTPATAQPRDLMLANARKTWRVGNKRLSERVTALRARLVSLRLGRFAKSKLVLNVFDFAYDGTSGSSRASGG